MDQLHFCPSTLAEGHQTYNRSALQNLFNKHKVHHVLPYDSPANSDGISSILYENRTIMSISGVQEKFSLLLEKNKLRLAKLGESGQYLIKPIPTLGKNRHLMPANEHLTMQIAKHLQKVLESEDVAVFIDAKHLCVSSRGVKDDTTSTITSYYGGKFQEENTKREFLGSIQS